MRSPKMSPQCDRITFVQWGNATGQAYSTFVYTAEISTRVPEPYSSKYRHHLYIFYILSPVLHSGHVLTRVWKTRLWLIVLHESYKNSTICREKNSTNKSMFLHRQCRKDWEVDLCTDIPRTTPRSVPVSNVMLRHSVPGSVGPRPPEPRTVRRNFALSF